MSSKNAKLFVANLSSKIDKRDLEDKFGQFGKILDIKIREGRNQDYYAFIEFENMADAEEACEKLRDIELFGRKARIEFSNGGRRREENRKPKEGSNCFVCGGEGHWASDCPNGAGQNIKKGTCFVCGSTRHKMNDCPKKKSGRSYSGSRSRSRSGHRHRGGDRRRDRSGSGSRNRYERRRDSRDRNRRDRSRSRDRNNSRRERSRDRYQDRDDRRRRSGSRDRREDRRDDRRDDRRNGDRGGRRDDSRDRD